MKSIKSAFAGNLQDSKGINLVISPKPKVARWIFAAVVALGLLSSSCSENTEKLTSLDGKSYRGDAAEKQIMGALMTGYYVAKFERDAKGNLQCKVTLHLHDSTEGWGEPMIETVPVNWEDRNPDYACIAKGSNSFDELGVAPDKITKESAPSEITLFDNDSNDITLRRRQFTEVQTSQPTEIQTNQPTDTNDPTGKWTSNDDGFVHSSLTIESSGNFRDFTFQTVNINGNVTGGYSGTWETNGTSIQFKWDGGSCSGRKTGRDSLVFATKTFHK